LSEESAGEDLPVPAEIRLETAIAAQELSGMEIENSLGKPSRFSCPECHGALWEINDVNRLRYRCHVGHAYSAESMPEAQTIDGEKMLRRLMRLHQERAALARRMAQKATVRSRSAEAAELRPRASEYDEDAEIIGRLLRQYAAAEEGDLAQETS
jgi:two-component system, chemotaxis family, protein-glutamate methylesterase/glutaminase